MGVFWQLWIFDHRTGDEPTQKGFHSLVHSDHLKEAVEVG